MPATEATPTRVASRVTPLYCRIPPLPVRDPLLTGDPPATPAVPHLPREDPVPRGPGRDGRPWRRAKERVRRTQGVCHLCGKPIDPTLKWPHPMSFSVDHIEPYSLRPELARDPNNLAAAHLSCNSSKGNGTRAADEVPTSRDW